ncbi:MAG: TatD family hydrolase [Myxococcales bacterium]|nr:TatD family hydrolase [Myxococcales bacterium]
MPHRGERCEPAFVVETLRCLASVQQLDPKELAEQLTTNTTRLFGIEGLS